MPPPEFSYDMVASVEKITNIDDMVTTLAVIVDVLLLFLVCLRCFIFAQRVLVLIRIRVVGGWRVFVVCYVSRFSVISFTFSLAASLLSSRDENFSVLAF